MPKSSAGQSPAASAPVAIVARAIESSVRDGEQQTHEGDSFVRSNAQIADGLALVKGLIKANGANLAVGVDHWDPGISRKIHEQKSLGS